jgi:hypothetical protein
MNMAVFWNVAPCSLVQTYLLLHVVTTLIIHIANILETLVNFYDTTRNTAQHNQLKKYNLLHS